MLAPIVAEQKRRVLEQPLLQSDDTHVQYQDRTQKGSTSRGFLWAYTVPWAEVAYDFTPTRSRSAPREFLEGYKGYLQVHGKIGNQALEPFVLCLEIAQSLHLGGLQPAVLLTPPAKRRPEDPVPAQELLDWDSGLGLLEGEHDLRLGELPGFSLPLPRPFRTGEFPFWRVSFFGRGSKALEVAIAAGVPCCEPDEVVRGRDGARVADDHKGSFPGPDLAQVLRARANRRRSATPPL